MAEDASIRAGLQSFPESGGWPAPHAAEPAPLLVQARLEVHQVWVVPLGVRSERPPCGTGGQHRDREAHLPPGTRQGQADHPGGLGGLRERRPRARRQRLPLRGPAGGQALLIARVSLAQMRVPLLRVHPDSSLVLPVQIAGVTGRPSPPSCPVHHAVLVM